VTCYTVTFPGGATGILCGKLGPKCSQCGDVADVVCDFPIPDENRTCDRPLCSRCSPEVGVDKNYCSEHLELGPGLVLFRRPERADEKAVTAEAGRQLMTKRSLRLPKAPPFDLRWAVLRDDVKITRWTNELSANRIAAELVLRGARAEVVTWDKFVAAWRVRYPLKPRRTKKDQIPGPENAHPDGDSI
jgi:hypothetical protein